MSRHYRYVLAACTLGALACSPGLATREEVEEYLSLRGALVAAETTFAGMRGRYASYRVRLTSSTGLEVTGQLLRPGRATPSVAYPAALLNDGRELNSAALRYLPPDFGDIVVLSLDYPEELPYELSFGSFIGESDELRRAARRIPAMFSLGASFLAQRDDVDASRLAIAATSFAVPFATIAAAADDRFQNVALIYGAGDMAEVLAANLSLRPAVLRDAAAWLAIRPFVGLAPERYIALISPRPIVFVNGIDDPQMPRSAVETLFEAAREPKTLIWLRTGHLMPGDSALIRQLVDTALARMPVLAGGGRREAGGGTAHANALVRHEPLRLPPPSSLLPRP